MNQSQIKAIQSKIGVEPDGFWGPKSIAACQKHLRKLMPTPNPWPKTDQASLTAFYGKAGDESNLTSIVPPFTMLYGGKAIKSLRCNKRVADSLLRVLTSLKGLIASDPSTKDEAEDYGGCFNFRVKRGGTSFSVHAYGAAIDLDADDNSFRDSWPMKADMPLEIMECFAREGWISAGAFWGYDSMHFEATR